MLKRVKRVLGYIRLHDDEGSKSKARQLWEMFLLATRYRFSPMEYDAFEFSKKAKDWPVMLSYLSNIEVNEKLRKPLYDPKLVVILNNKLLFNRFFSAYGLPLPELYGCLNPESGFLSEGGPLRTPEDLAAWLSRGDRKEIFVKPVGGLQGFNAIMLKNTQDGRLLACEEGSCVERSPKELYQHLFQDIPEKRFYFPGFLFEQALKQHPALARFNDTSVNTCRIVTIKTRAGMVETPFAMLRIGRTGRYVDNLNQGGLAAGVDMATGRVGKATGYSKHGYMEWHTVHPDSGIPIEGFQVPRWREARELAIRAASVIPAIKTVGWDVAVTEQGPFLIEGNSSWTPILIQKLNQGLLTPHNLEIFGQYGLKLR